MRTIVGLVSGFGWHVEDLRRAADRLDLHFEACLFSSVTGQVDSTGRIAASGIDLRHAGAVLVRMMPPGTLEQVVFRMDTLHRLEAAGVPVWNPPRAVEIAVDKYLATARLAAAGLPVPRTWVGEMADEAGQAFEALGRDVVVKPLFGSEGRGITRVTDPAIALRVFRALERIGAVLYLQAHVPNPGQDCRVFVLEDRVLGAMRRHAAPDDWRTNVALGGRAELCSLDPAEAELARRAAAAVGAVMAGVDLLTDLEGRTTILEVNAVPGWKAFSSVTGIDVATEILTALRARAL